jgi:hypothetical protein
LLPGRLRPRRGARPYHGRVTYNHAQPASSSAPAGAGADVKTFAAAVLLTFGTGLLMFIGNGLLDSFFGAILGLVAGIFGIVFWKNKHGKVFPDALPTRSVILLLVIDIVLAGGLLLMIS